MNITSRNFVETTEERIAVAAEGYKGDLSAYLRSLLLLFLQAENEPVTFQLLQDLIVGAFGTDPLEFDPSWLEVANPEYELFDDDDEFVKGMSMEMQFDVTRRMLLFHIADYHRIEEAGLLNSKYRFVCGVKSPTGWHWYNFHPLDFIELGIRGHESELLDDPVEQPEGWTTLAHILCNGSTHE